MKQIRHPSQLLVIAGQPVAELSVSATAETGAAVEESCWQLSPEELDSVQATGCVFLLVVKQGEQLTVLPGTVPVVETAQGESDDATTPHRDRLQRVRPGSITYRDRRSR